MTSDKFLPGLEGDPSGAVLENWSDSDWKEWFASEVEPTGLWYGLARTDDMRQILRDHAVGEDPEFVEAMRGLLAGLPDDFDLGLDSSDLFQRASFEIKSKFYRSWYRMVHSLDVDSGVSGTSGSTMVPVRTGNKTAPWKTIIVTGMAALGIGVGVAVVNSGGDTDNVDDGVDASSTSSDWTVDDALGDIGPAFDDLSPLDDPDPAGDIAVMSASAKDGATSVVIRFAGAAKDLSINSDQTLNAGLLVVLPDGGSIDILFEDGGCKISDASTAGGRISCRWLDDRDLELKIDGWTPVPGTNMTFATYQESNSALGVSSDTVELETD